MAHLHRPRGFMSGPYTSAFPYNSSLAFQLFFTLRQRFSAGTASRLNITLSRIDIGLIWEISHRYVFDVKLQLNFKMELGFERSV